MSRNVKDIKEVAIPDSYKLIKYEYLPDCKGLGIYLKHVKSGARICVISNDDKNKVFNIAFRTPPTDDTGVAHIIEHSVLCGSEKFKAKDPFVELAKGSLNTFLNAMTYPDKTCYPVASCNDKDYANLMDVYMDAVLHPNIYNREEIFKQEGWHYEISDKDEPLTYNGVVYSEMKGAFSSPDDRFMRGTFDALFPDNAYGVESGGHPKAIPTLTYENFLDFHSRYYHPTNSYIFFYGDLDIEERLSWIDAEYLSHYTESPVDSAVKLQKPIGTVTVSDEYPLADGDSEEDAAYFSWAFLVEKSDDLMTNTAVDALCEVLFNTPGAPVREALIKAGIGQDVACGVEFDVMQPFGMLAIRNVEADKFDRMREILTEELTRAAREGVNRKSLLSAINKAEFSMREADFGRIPKGLEYTLDMLTTWLYDDDNPFAMMHRCDLFGKLRESIDTGYFEKLIDRYMLHSESNVFFTLLPKKGLGRKLDAELNEKLAGIKASLSDSELDALIKDTAALKAYQAEPSTAEELLSIPQLSREDIDRDLSKPINEIRSIKGIQTVYHDIETNGIIYLDFYFDISRITAEDIPYIGLAGNLIGNMDTTKHSYFELNNEIGIHLGGLTGDTLPINRSDMPSGYMIKKSYSGKALKAEVRTLISLLMETAFDTDFTDGSRMRELLNEAKASFQYNFVAAGHKAALQMALSTMFNQKRVSAMLTGREQYEFICGLLEKSDEELSQVGAHIREILDALQAREGLMFNVTCTEDIYSVFEAAVSEALEAIPEKYNEKLLRDEQAAPVFNHAPAKRAYKIAGDVNYVSMAGHVDALNTRGEASCIILGSMLSMDYLWNNIRVLGGAYGCGFKYLRTLKAGGFYSYRDPNLKETLDVYRKTVDFLRSFDADDRQMTKFILGTIGAIDMPMSPSAKGVDSLEYIMTGKTYEELNELRHAIIDATPEDIRAVADVFEKLVADDNYCVIGNESKIEENAELFDTIKNGQ